jgi:hypothetical protein
VENNNSLSKHLVGRECWSQVKDHGASSGCRPVVTTSHRTLSVLGSLLKRSFIIAKKVIISDSIIYRIIGNYINMAALLSSVVTPNSMEHSPEHYWSPS